MGWNGLDLVNDFSAELGDTSSAFKTKTLRWINQGTKDIATRHNWAFLRERGRFILAESEDTHSIVLAKPAAPTIDLDAGGSLTDGSTYKALVTFFEEISQVESVAGYESNLVIPTATDLSFIVSDLPASLNTLVTARKIYVSKDNGAFQYHGVVSNNLTEIEAVAASLLSQGITFTALVAGVAGNSITVEVVDSLSGGLTFSELSGEIIIDLGGAIADIDSIIALLATSTYVLATGSGASTVAVAAQDSLINGADVTPVTYTVSANPSSQYTPPEENAIKEIDGNIFLSGNRIIFGTSIQDLIYKTGATNSSGTPQLWAPVNQEEILVYPKPNDDTEATFYYFKIPAQIFGVVTSIPQIPSWLYDDLRNYVLWRGYDYRDRDGKESKQINYENGIKNTIQTKSKPVKGSGRVRCVTPDSDGNGV